MSTDNAKAADGVTVDKDSPVIAEAEERRDAVLKDELKAARQRVKDAQAHLAALEKETGK